MRFNTINSTIDDLPQFKSLTRKRQSQLLNAILLVLIPITIFFSIFNIMIMTNFDQLFSINSYFDAFFGLTGLLVVYLINRSEQFRLAVWTLIIFSGLIVTIHVLNSTPPHHELSHYILLLMIAKALLNNRELLLTTALIIMCIMFTMIVVETVTVFAAWNIGTFVIILYFLLKIVSDYRSNLESDRRGIIQSSELRLRLLLNQVPALVWVTDQDLNIESFNDNQHELIDDFYEYLHHACAPHIANIQNTTEITFDHQWKDRHYQNTIQVIHDKHQGFVGYLGTTFDITERKTAEKHAIEVAKK